MDRIRRWRDTELYRFLNNDGYITTSNTSNMGNGWHYIQSATVNSTNPWENGTFPLWCHIDWSNEPDKVKPKDIHAVPKEELDAFLAVEQDS